MRRIIWADQSRAAVAVRTTLTGRGSSAEVTSDSGTLVKFRDGSLVRATIYRTTEGALEAASLRE